ncbi:Cyclin-dependent protein kinase, partial [Lunasporangiospora selenospora]
FSEPLSEYTSFLDHLREYGYARDEFTRIPFNLIDLAAAVIASVLTGRELSLFGTAMGHSNPKDFHGSTKNSGDAATASKGASSDNSNDNDNNKGARKHKAQDTLTSPLGSESAPDQDSHSWNGDTSKNDDSVFYFIQRILKRTQLSCTTLILALIYVDRFKTKQARKRRTRLDQGPDHESAVVSFSLMRKQLSRSSAPETHTSSSAESSQSSSPQNPIPPDYHGHQQQHASRSSTPKSTWESWSSISLFLVSVICADKYLYDATYSNAEWAEFTRGQYTTQELNDLERRFLGQLQYRLYVSEPEFHGFLTYLEVIMALRQVWGRGFTTALSYSDVRILTQQLMPNYADRLHFKTLQGDMAVIVWQVVSAITRMYLTVVGAVMIAIASYKAVTQLTFMPAHWPTDALVPLMYPLHDHYPNPWNTLSTFHASCDNMRKRMTIGYGDALGPPWTGNFAIVETNPVAQLMLPLPLMSESSFPSGLEGWMDPLQTIECY